MTVSRETQDKLADDRRYRRQFANEFRFGELAELVAGLLTVALQADVPRYSISGCFYS